MPEQETSEVLTKNPTCLSTKINDMKRGQAFTSPSCYSGKWGCRLSKRQYTFPSQTLVGVFSEVNKYLNSSALSGRFRDFTEAEIAGDLSF